ncbi:Reverse transcriptase domain [Trinorchestia longiramus]|nr:Reverse transcriptase domain [Trinorchestia longiramus]
MACDRQMGLTDEQESPNYRLVHSRRTGTITSRHDMFVKCHIDKLSVVQNEGFGPADWNGIITASAVPPQRAIVHHTKCSANGFSNYLSGRQAYVHYNGKSSKTRNIQNRVPQGSVLSPTLFNLYMHDIPQPPENIHIAQHGDDITITSTHSNVSTCSTQVQDYMDTINTWMKPTD